jgi:hypothetical protein
VLGNASGINLNNDSLDKISKVGGLGLILATRIAQNRPFRRWGDLEKIEGFDEEMVNDLRGSGAVLGRPRISSKTSGPPRRIVPLRKIQPKSAEVGPLRKAGKQATHRRARNIFSGEGDGLE